MSPGSETFLWAAAASVAVEIVALNRALSVGRRSIPAGYRRPSFWVARALLAVIAGGLALAHGANGDPWLAIHIGAATPLLVQRMALELRATSPPVAAGVDAPARRRRALRRQRL